MSYQGLQGKTKYEAMRKSKTYDIGRVCSKKGCTTGISMYNKKDTCFNHSPRSYGRVRGHIDPRTR